MFSEKHNGENPEELETVEVCETVENEKPAAEPAETETVETVESAETEEIAQTEVQQVFIDGVDAVIKQPLKDIFILSTKVETYGCTYPKPHIKYWVK